MRQAREDLWEGANVVEVLVGKELQFLGRQISCTKTLVEAILIHRHRADQLVEARKDLFNRSGFSLHLGSHFVPLSPLHRMLMREGTMVSNREILAGSGRSLAISHVRITKH